MKSTTLLIACLCALTSTIAAASVRTGRPMIIHRLPELNLEIWTEQDPEWETHLGDFAGVFTFIAETPALTYPPAYMSWTVMKELKLSQHQLEDAARGVLYQMAMNYRTNPPKEIRPRSYGDLTGFEATLDVAPDGTPSDVLLFCGHREGRPIVVMQVVTLKDRLPHLSEQIRRSWTNVRYLD
jgi:hypothetical protein